MTDDLAPLRHAPQGLTVKAIPRLELCVGQASTGKAPCLYRSMICFILQGSKRVAINDNLLSYDSAQYLISALDLPLIGWSPISAAARFIWWWVCSRLRWRLVNRAGDRRSTSP